MFVVRPASMLVREERLFWGVDVLPTLPRALGLALIGAVSFVVGYELRVGRRLAVRLPAPRPVHSRLAAASAFVTAGIAVGTLLILLPVSEGLDSLRILVSGRSAEFGELLQTSTYITNGSFLLVPAAIVLVGLAIRDRTPLLLGAAAIVLTLALARVAPAGGRIVMLPLIGSVFVLAYVMRDRRPSPAVLATVGLLALVGSYLTLAVRDPTDRMTVRTAVEQLGDRPQAVLDPVIRSADAEMVLALSAALTIVPDELQHRWGDATIGNLVTRPVPREWWPRKPLPPSETVVAKLWPDLYPGLNPAFSPLLVLYWDFGIAGVAVGMALFGLLWRVFYEWFLLHRRAFAAQLLFASGLWFVVIGARNDPVDTIVLGAFLFMPVLGIVAVASEGVLVGQRARGKPTWSGEPNKTP